MDAGSFCSPNKVWSPLVCGLTCMLGERLGKHLGGRKVWQFAKALSRLCFIQTLNVRAVFFCFVFLSQIKIPLCLFLFSSIS